MKTINNLLTIALIGAVCGVGLGITLSIADFFNEDLVPVLEKLMEQNESYSSATSEASSINGTSMGASNVAMFPYQLNCFGVKASIFGVERSFLVDTGCSYSMINKATYETLKKKGKMDGVKLYKENLQMADNSITTMQWFYASFKIADTTVTHARCFIIEDKTAKNILGMSVLAGSVIDFDNNTISFN